MKKTSFNISRLGYIVILLAVLVLVNLISINWFTRIDLTDGKIYTLSKASRDAVKNLPDRLTVKCYFTKDLPSPYSSNARYLKDQLEEYRANSNGNFEFVFADPADEAELETEAQGYHIAPHQVNVVESDKIELKKVYMGIVFLYQDKSETLPLIQTTSGLEYEITSTIKRITSDSIPKLGFLQGHNEADPNEDMTAIGGLLQKNYQVTTVDLSAGQTVPEDIDGLLIIQPETPFSEWELFAIDQYIMRGGKVGFLASQVSANLQEARAMRLDLNLDDFTSNFGFRINSDLVYDQKCGMVNIQQNQGFFTIRSAVAYPFFPLIRNFDKTNAVVRDLSEINIYFASSIDTMLAPKDSAGTFQFKTLAWTSEKSNRQVGRYEINPMGPQFQQMVFPMANIPVAATIIGNFRSYFAGKEIPEPREGETYNGQVLTESQPARIIVVGDGKFVMDSYLTSRTNADFFMNLVDWLAQDESLISIRSRDVAARPLDDISESAKKAVKYANIFLPSLAVIIIGLVRWQIRRRKKITLS